MYEGDHFGEIIWARYASDSEIRDRYYEGDSKSPNSRCLQNGRMKLPMV